jgi:PAS domain S-box-containing protein
MKVRIAFFTFIILSISALLYYNQLQSQMTTDYSKRVEIIVFIFVITCVVGLFIVYRFYHLMHSEMKEQVELLTASKNDLQTTYDSVPMFMIEISSDYKVINTNEAVCKYFGRKKHHIIGASLDKVLSFDEKSMSTLETAVRATFSNNKNGKTEIENAGSIFEVFTFPLQDSADKLKKVLLMLNDVTHTRALYKQMLQDNKMVAVGQLAAGVAHEIRNPLGLIRNYCHLLKKSAADDEEMRNKAIFMIEKAVDRSGDIIDNLLQFSRVTNDKWVEANLYQAIQSIISLEENVLMKNNIKLSLNCSQEIRTFIILESLEVILINLINNAVEAMEINGQIKIDCIEDSDEIILTIADTGEGIPEEIRGSIFNPFFTTKENRNGCGLGLYIVYNEVTKLGGTIKADSITGEGTTFTIILPVKREDKTNEQ